MPLSVKVPGKWQGDLTADPWLMGDYQQPLRVPKLYDYPPYYAPPPTSLYPQEQQRQEGISPQQIKQAYDLYNQYQTLTSPNVYPGSTTGATGPIAAPAASTGLLAVPGGAGYGTAAGGAAHSAGVAAVPGGLSNAAVGGGGAAAGGMMAMAPLALFGLGMLWATSEARKGAKEGDRWRAARGLDTPQGKKRWDAKLDKKYKEIYG